MTPLRVSVVVVSHGRPDALGRCLRGIAQLDYPAFEVVVVCDAPSRSEVIDPQVKTVVFDGANISEARNLGVAQAAGEIIAFIDDDAVPEPNWLVHLAGPFAADKVAATGGYVIGRNGISFQWTARMAFADGSTEPLPLEGTTPRLLTGKPGQAIKTEGTNMAIRRDLLVAMGGFDPAYRFYLDETDINMRLAAEGHVTAIVPLAQVHHGFAASARRTVQRIPRDLTEIGASSAVFARKFGDNGGIETAHYADRAAQRSRLIRLMVRGDLMPGCVRRLLAGFDAGWAQGMRREIGRKAEFGGPPAFRPMPQRFSGHRVMYDRFWRASTARAKARAVVKEGQRVSLFLLSATGRYHVVRFTEDGVWEQKGGQFGKSRRDMPMLQFWTARRRVAMETRRLSQLRDTLPSQSGANGT
ncbi:MAG: glycosyltransferase family 2 protein [Paracoccaceae bacterium]